MGIPSRMTQDWVVTRPSTQLSGPQSLVKLGLSVGVAKLNLLDSRRVLPPPTARPVSSRQNPQPSNLTEPRDGGQHHSMTGGEPQLQSQGRETFGRDRTDLAGSDEFSLLC